MVRRKMTWQDWCTMALAICGLVAILLSICFDNKFFQISGMLAVTASLVWMHIYRTDSKGKDKK